MQHQRQQNKSLIFINKKKKFFLEFKYTVGIQIPCNWTLTFTVERFYHISNFFVQFEQGNNKNFIVVKFNKLFKGENTSY